MREEGRACLSLKLLVLAERLLDQRLELLSPTGERMATVSVVPERQDPPPHKKWSLLLRPRGCLMCLLLRGNRHLLVLFPFEMYVHVTST